MWFSQRDLWQRVLRVPLASLLLLSACGDGEGASVESPGDTNGGGGAEMGSGGAGAPPGGDLGDTGLDSSGASAGCGLASPAGSAFTLDVEGQAAQYIVILPPNYDPMRSYPLAFAFHGSNRTHEDCWLRDCLGFWPSFQADSIIVFMRSLAAGWNDVAREQNVLFFSSVLSRLKSEYCVDQGRVVVAGTSSGAHFSNILACRFGDLLQSAAPVAGSLLERSECVGRVAALVVHGVDDTQVPFADGEEARDYYVQRNGCEAASMPPVSDLHARIRAARDQGMSDSGCVDFQGCDPGYPVRWCEHSEGGYDNSTHGWPTVGGQLVRDFVQAL